MAEAIAAAAKALLKKLAVDTVLDKDKRNKILLIVGSIVVGLLFLLFAPIAVLSSMGKIESPDISVNFDENDFMSGTSGNDEFNDGGRSGNRRFNVCSRTSGADYQGTADIFFVL